ncbi:MAG TPA: glycosyltransferase family 9 protein [Opitutaceae bacterium]
MNLVIFKFNKLGDSVVFVSAVQAIRRRFPEWRITLLTTPAEAELYAGAAGPDEVLVCPKEAFERAYRRPWVLASWLWKIRRRNPKACIVPFDQGTTAHFLAGLSGASRRIGAKLVPPRMPGSLTVEIPCPDDGRPVTWSWLMVQVLVDPANPSPGLPKEPPAPDLSHLLAQDPRPPGDRPRVVVHAGASRDLNQWSIGNFAAVAVSLCRDFEVTWISHGETAGKAPRGTIDRPVGTVGELARALSGADLFLGNNSGPMHLANALGCRGVVVTGSSARGWDPYWYRERWTVLRHPNLACAPCEKLQAVTPGCANIEHPMACMAYWTPERVEQECRDNLAISR